jgi:hypothetical protein
MLCGAKTLENGECKTKTRKGGKCWSHKDNTGGGDLDEIPYGMTGRMYSS